MVCSWAQAGILVPSSPKTLGHVLLCHGLLLQQREQSPRGRQAACIAAVPGSDLCFLKNSASGLGEAWLSLKDDLPNFWLLQPELSSWTHVSSLCHPPAPLPRTPWLPVPSRGYVRAEMCSPLLSCCGGLQASHFFHFSTPVRRPLSPHPMPSMFLAISGLCWLLHEVEIKGEHCLGLCRVGAILCSPMGCILP